MSEREVILRSTPATVSWGWIAADRAPVARVKSGQRLRIETVTHQGLNTDQDPVALFGAAGIAPGEVLSDAVEIYRKVRRGEGAGPHLLTGPVYVEGAQPGDLLEVRVLEVAIRVPYGINATGPGRGAVPDLLAQAAQKVIRLDLERGVALFTRSVEVPLAPFMGIMAVAPPAELKRVSTKPPGAFGGNLDFRHLVAGSTLYLPVFNDGALFYTGDGHACQGDGEVDGTAIEISLTPTVQLIVRKGYRPGVDSYSAFLEADRKTSTGLAAWLRELAIRRLWFCGLATDFCVGWSALDARAAGFEAVVIEDACRAIDLNGSLEAAWKQMAAAGVGRVRSDALAL